MRLVLKYLPEGVVVASVAAIIISVIKGLASGWLSEVWEFQFLGQVLASKPITLGMYASLALVISLCFIILSWDHARDIPFFIGVMFFVPESVYLYELIWHFLNWQTLGFANSIYTVYYTKLNVVELFGSIALQVMVLHTRTMPKGAECKVLYTHKHDMSGYG